jgi:uncharacterized membrane protein
MGIAAFIYRLAVAAWVGGAALFTFVLTPAIFRHFDRDRAGEIVGVLFPGYFLWGLAAGLTALAFLVPSRNRHVTASAVILVLMLAVTSLQFLVVEPRAAALKREIPSFVTTPADHPARRAFRKLHGLSAAGNLGVIGGGIALLALL